MSCKWIALVGLMAATGIGAEPTSRPSMAGRIWEGAMRGLDDYARLTGAKTWWADEDGVRPDGKHGFAEKGGSPAERDAKKREWAREMVQFGLAGAEATDGPYRVSVMVVVEPAGGPPRDSPPRRATAVPDRGSRTVDPTPESAVAQELTPTGKTIYTGPRGGRYHYSSSGKKVYEKKR